VTEPLSPSAAVAPIGGGAASPRAVQGGETAAPATSTTPQPAPPSPQGGPLPALEAAMQDAAGRQGGLASLLADLTLALRTPGLPAPVLAAAAKVLGQPLPLDPAPTGADLRQALAQSGLFLEAQLATPRAPVGADLKAALLQLGQALETWLASAPERSTSAAAAAAATPAAPAPSPPYRGGPVRAQPPAAPSLPPNASAEIVGHRLMQETSAAVARQLLLQAASLAKAPHAQDPASGPQWRFEIPVLTPQGAGVAQFEISRDGRQAAGDDERQPVWRARFSLDAAPMGPVHAKIALTGDQARVTLWAENEDTAARLNARSGDLVEALRGDALSAAVSVFPGAPSVAAPAAGRLVDLAR
jgi:hypothetical protein